MHYWLLKTEPGAYSIDDLAGERVGQWDGVRNYAARKNLMTMQKGDLAVIYHSVNERAAVGLATVEATAYPDPTVPKAEKEKGWVAVKVRFTKKFNQPVTLSALRQEKTFEDSALVTQSRLSVQPLTEKQFKKIVMLAKDM